MANQPPVFGGFVEFALSSSKANLSVPLCWARRFTLTLAMRCVVFLGYACYLSENCLGNLPKYRRGRGGKGGKGGEGREGREGKGRRRGVDCDRSASLVYEIAIQTLIAYIAGGI